MTRRRALIILDRKQRKCLVNLLWVIWASTQHLSVLQTCRQTNAVSIWGMFLIGGWNWRKLVNIAREGQRDFEKVHDDSEEQA